METSYDQVLYPGFPYSQTHPDRLATVATLFGMHPSPVERCRVLELGCGDGSNLIPMAFTFPNSAFTGFDLADAAVAMGRDALSELGLTNVRLEAADILQLGPDLGQFDYIIAHGVYSWVPEEVRDRVLHIMYHHLAPQGVAYVSYNALPGCHLRQMLRDMMFYHLRNTSGPEARMQQALEFLHLLLRAPDSKETSTLKLMKDEVQDLLDRNPAILFHDELSEFWYPIHFSDFMAHASAHGLQYLGEANMFDMEPRKFSSELREEIETHSRGQRLDREQYMDFLKFRKFRQTLLCHANLEIGESVIWERVRTLYAASPAKPASAQPDFTGERPEEFRGPKGAAMKTAHPLAKTAIGQLSKMWPEATQFEALLQQCDELTGKADPEGLAEILLAMYRAGLVELHICPPMCVSKAGAYPSTTPLARWQAQRGSTITTLRHSTIEATGEVERRLLTLLDGTRNRADLAADLAARMDPPVKGCELKDELDRNLEKLARFGLLTA